MSTALPPRPRNVSSSKSKFAIVASIYNEEFTNALVENTISELGEIFPNSHVEVIRVPGAFEIPVTVEAVLAQDMADVVIGLGLIIRGSTQHGDLVAESVTNQLQASAVRHRKPVIHEVLLVDDEKQAYARCIGAQLNRGREAARAAALMADLFANKLRDSNDKRPLTRQYPSNA